MDSSFRQIQCIVRAQSTSDGQGVKLKRTIGAGGLAAFDPFLMLDEFGSDQASDYQGGFPEHPHRGFETVTYMLAGSMEHRDHLGNVGLMGPGSVQWMTAAHGILHSEMPKQEAGLMHGFQLWINLPAREKMKAPAYQEYSADEIPQASLPGGGSARVIAGVLKLDNLSVCGPVSGISTQPVYFDLQLTADEIFTQPVQAQHQVLIYVYQGEFDIGEAGQTVAKETLAVLTQGDLISLVGRSADNRCLLLAGKPLNEPIANAGPFVMNSDEELQQAFTDYRNGVLTTMNE